MTNRINKSPFTLSLSVQIYICLVLVLVLTGVQTRAEYQLHTVILPEDLVLEVSGMDNLPDGRMVLTTRRGEVWVLSNPDEPTSATASTPRFERWLTGLHEPLGLSFHKMALYVAQRSEITRIPLREVNGALEPVGRIETAATGWGLSGNYHEYAYGPAFDGDGRAWVTLNASIGKGLDGAPPAYSGWRGWALAFNLRPELPTIDLTPMAHGLRSPAGIASVRNGEIFATDQQGNWIPTCSLIHLNQGNGPFFGHRDSLGQIPTDWHLVGGGDNTRESPASDIIETAEAMEEYYSGSQPAMTVAEAVRRIPGYRPPAIWFPYRTMGMSATGIAEDTSGGAFGPFSGQVFVGEFTMSMVLRVHLERVGGIYQGSCIRFMEGLDSAAFRLAFSHGHRLFIGQTNRGWNSLGNRAYGLQFIEWNESRNTLPEIEYLELAPDGDGFDVHFTRAVKAIPDPGDIGVSAYTYRLHQAYGSEQVVDFNPEIVKVAGGVGSHGEALHLTIEPMMPGYVYELDFSGVKLSGGDSPMHPVVCYTLNSLPGKE